MHTIDLVYFNAGGGHRSAALALEAVIRHQGRPWQIRPVNLMHVLDPKDIFKKTLGMEWEDLYSTRLARGWSLGLDPDRPTGIVLFGGHGSKAMQGIARRLKDTQLILICGHNAALHSRLAAMPHSAPRLVVGFTPKIRDYMQLSDFFIGKPGPGSISEAIQQGLPVIVVNNTWTMPQERYNAEWVLENRVGRVLDSFKAIRGGVDDVIARLPQLRARVARIENRAIFEIPDILEALLRESRKNAPPESRYHRPAVELPLHV